MSAESKQVYRVVVGKGGTVAAIYLVAAKTLGAAVERTVEFHGSRNSYIGGGQMPAPILRAQVEEGTFIEDEQRTESDWEAKYRALEKHREDQEAHIERQAKRLAELEKQVGTREEKIFEAEKKAKAALRSLRSANDERKILLEQIDEVVEGKISDTPAILAVVDVLREKFGKGCAGGCCGGCSAPTAEVEDGTPA